MFYLGVKEDLTYALIELALKTDDNGEYAKFFEEKVYPKFNELEKFFGNKMYIAGDYLTYEDFDF